MKVKSCHSCKHWQQSVRVDSDGRRNPEVMGTCTKINVKDGTEDWKDLKIDRIAWDCYKCEKNGLIITTYMDFVCGYHKEKMSKTISPTFMPSVIFWLFLIGVAIYCLYRVVRFFI